ncbi:MAG: BtpA/SgcQ family protein [Deltaproteobacteria bacterium]|nr:BtpA/SgcQ family protein [Chloroflexota bacterium]MBM3300670.1 BtpA/SgcQ family protein [Deltaproteobacteria bacterium]
MFQVEKPIIGMVHLASLPGSPGYVGNLDEVASRALEEAKTLWEGGVSAILVENLNDYPFFPETTEPETVASMTRIAHEIRKAIPLPIGIQVLRNSWQSSIAIASVIGGSFIRLNVLTDALVTDQGLIQGVAHKAARYRQFLGAQGVKFFADIYSKHGAPLAARPLGVVARDMAYRGMADAIIVSGEETPDPPRKEDIEAVKKAVPDRPVILGSGMTISNVELLRYADGAIFGYGAKKDGDLRNPVDLELTKQFVSTVRESSYPTL